MKSKKFVLVGFVLLAITMVLLPLSGCKTEVDTSSPQQEQTGENAGTGDNDSNGTSDNPSAGNDGDTGSDETEIGYFGSPFGSGWNNETDLQ